MSDRSRVVQRYKQTHGKRLSSDLSIAKAGSRVVVFEVKLPLVYAVSERAVGVQRSEVISKTVYYRVESFPFFGPKGTFTNPGLRFQFVH